MSQSRKIKLPVEKLLVGLMIDLELSWTQHPFLFSKFKISSVDDLNVIKGLDIKEVTVFPEQSDIQVAQQHKAAGQSDGTSTATHTTEDKWQEKKTKMANADRYRKKRQAIAKKYKEQATMVRKLTKELKTSPANAIRNAEELVESLAGDFDTDNEMMTNLVNLGSEDHSTYNHCINVTILSMSLASAKGIGGDELRLVARGALLHDVGKIEIPGPILNKKTPLTSAETGVFQQHTRIGHRLCERIEDTPTEVLDIIEQHHEYLDGSGYPKQLKGGQIGPLARIVSVANMYDNLCNPVDIRRAMTPKIALATMYSKFKEKLDHDLVQCFISTLGVYPPGSVVHLNDDSIGLVVSVDPSNMMKPEVLLYNPDIPPLQALIINLVDHDDLKVNKVLKPGEYPKRVYEYLGIKERIGFMTSH